MPAHSPTRQETYSSFFSMTSSQEQTTSFLDAHSLEEPPAYRITELELPRYSSLYPQGSALHPPTYDGLPRERLAAEENPYSFTRPWSRENGPHVRLPNDCGIRQRPVLWNFFSISCLIWCLFGVGIGTWALLFSWLNEGNKIMPILIVAVVKTLMPSYQIIRFFPQVRVLVAKAASVLHFLVDVAVFLVALIPFIIRSEDAFDLSRVVKWFVENECSYSEIAAKVQCSTWLSSFWINRIMSSVTQEDLRKLPMSFVSQKHVFFMSYLEEYSILCGLCGASLIFSLLVVGVMLVDPSKER